MSDFKIEGWVEPGFYLFLKGVDGPVVPICHMHVQNISLMGCDLAYFLASGLEPSLNIRSKSHHKCLRHFEITAIVLPYICAVADPENGGGVCLQMKIIKRKFYNFKRKKKIKIQKL